MVLLFVYNLCGKYRTLGHLRCRPFFFIEKYNLGHFIRGQSILERHLPYDQVLNIFNFIILKITHPY